MTCDANCQLTEYERRVIAEMRLLEKIARRGGMIKAFYDGKGGWRVTLIRK